MEKDENWRKTKAKSGVITVRDVAKNGLRLDVIKNYCSNKC